MQKNKSNLLLLVQRVLLLLVFYTLCRLLFFVFNLSYFSGITFAPLVKDLFFGLRFDLSAIIISNIVFISLHLFPFRFFYQRYYQLLLKMLFLIVNIPLLLFSFIDIGLFRFSSKHATMDVFKVIGFGEDFINTVPSMITDFWYLLLIFLLMMVVLVKAYNKINLEKKINSPETSTSFSKLSLLHIIFLTLIIVGFRGGIQYKPVSIISASQYGSSKDVALILNTPFTLLKSYDKDLLREVNYFPKDEAEKISPYVHQYSHAQPFRNLNVVLIILEGIGKEYIGSLNHYEGYTPFLDSLISEGLVFNHAFANGKRSIEGIPGIVSGIPSLMSDPFITSAYAGNSINSIASLLKKKGYVTSFYHGGTNGTMGFDNFTHLAGFESYYGRKEYNNDKDFDGNWGIYDGPFLQNFAKQLNGMKPPFFSALFTLSSHHPYAIPKELQGKFKEGTLPIHKSVRYTDYALREFFETASKMPWFDSTLFVITSDHTALSDHPVYQNRVGLYSIPIIFYRHNSNLKGISDLTTQQIDIMPSILNYLHFDEPFFSFGESVFDTAASHFAVNYLNDTYQVIAGDYSLVLDTLKDNSLYRYTTDPMLKLNLAGVDTIVSKQMEIKLKAFIENYNEALIKNKMTIQEAKNISVEK